MSVCTMTPALAYLSTHKLTNQHARQPVNLSARQHAPPVISSTSVRVNFSAQILTL